MESFWLFCLAYFEKELSSQQFNTWIKPLRLDSASDTAEPTLIAPNRFVLQWVKDNFLPLIDEMAEQHFSQAVNFQLRLAHQSPAKACPPGMNHAKAVIAVEKHAAKPAQKVSGGSNPSRLNPAFTFNSFVTGKANQLARAGAIQVAERPGTAYNPFFIYGGVGLGK
ncbi:MAG: chromosomal replication initiator protein DnaA, partial [Nitrosospira sp.]|nr:chromosomal replication initiator protein DnaA [Nitrosospira sp.]